MHDILDATGLEQIFKVLDAYARKFHLIDLNVNLTGHHFQSQFGHSTAPTYTIRIDLPLGSSVNFRVPMRDSVSDIPASDFASTVLRVFNAQRLSCLRREPAPSPALSVEALALDRSG